MRYIRWQAVIAALGIVLLTALLSYSSYTFTSVEVPDRGGIYREGIAGNPQFLNPLLSQYNDVDRDLVALLFNGLMKFDEDGRVVPDLAADMPEISDDGLIYIFRLRSGLRWHDGEPVTAQDVVYNVTVLRDPDFPGVPYLGNLWRTVQAEAVNELTVRFTLTESFTPFLDYTTIGLLPAHYWRRVPVGEMDRSQLNTLPIGTGPFMMTDISARSIKLEPNPRYHGPTPFLGAVEFVFYPDQQSLFTAYEKGEIDGISQVLPSDLPRAAMHEELQLFYAPQSGYSMVLLNLNNDDAPFFQERNVRQALMFGLNRRAMLEEVLQGQGVIAESPIMPGVWAYHEETEKYRYDPERARLLLDLAGWRDEDGDGVRSKDGRLLEFVLLCDEDKTRIGLAEAISKAWADIGVRALPQQVPFMELVGDHLQPRQFQAAIIAWELSGDPIPIRLWHSTQASETGQNYSGWDHEEAMRSWKRYGPFMTRCGDANSFDNSSSCSLKSYLVCCCTHPVYAYGVSDKVKNVHVGRLNDPSDRFATIHEWYIVTRRIPITEAQASRR